MSPKVINLVRRSRSPAQVMPLECDVCDMVALRGGTGTALCYIRFDQEHVRSMILALHMHCADVSVRTSLCELAGSEATWHQSR